MVTDPDYLNQKLLEHMASRENVRNNLNNRFSHAVCYEDFIRLIKSSNNVDELRQLHLRIMNEIAKVTIINDFKASSSSSLPLAAAAAVAGGGVSSSHISSSVPNLTASSHGGVITCGSSSFFASFAVPTSVDEAVAVTATSTSPVNTSGGGGGEKSSGKADPWRSRDLKVYIKHLRYAKLLCERRLNRLNVTLTPSKSSPAINSSSMFYDEDANDFNFENKLKNRKVRPFYCQFRYFIKLLLLSTYYLL